MLKNNQFKSMKNLSKSMSKKVVILGGGNGVAITLQALKTNLNLFDISPVVSMSDSGGSSGKLRQEFKTLPTGDILRSVLASSKYDYSLLRKIFNKNRFEENSCKLSGHSLGNMFLVLASKYNNDFIKTIRGLEQVVESQVKSYPVTLDVTDLVVELENCEIIKTEGVIDRPKYDRNLKIKKAWLEPVGKIYKDAKEKIEEADYIFLGPGSLYCSVIATLLPGGVKEAIENSKAKLIYIAGNGYEKIGETGPERLSDFVSQLQSYLPRKLDTVIYNNHKFDKEEEEKYKNKNWGVIKFDPENLEGYNIKTYDFESSTSGLDPKKLGRLLKNILCK